MIKTVKPPSFELGHAERSLQCEAALAPSIMNARANALAVGWTSDEISFALVNLALADFQNGEAARALEEVFNMDAYALRSPPLRIDAANRSEVE